MTLLPKLPSLSGWKPFLDEAEAFNRIAVKGPGRPAVFTPEILYNIIAMAIEKYVMAYLIHARNLPDNHTMADLVDGLRRVGNLDDDLAEELLFIDSFQEICSVDNYNRTVPTDAEIRRMIGTCNRIREVVLSRLPSEPEDAPVQISPQ